MIQAKLAWVPGTDAYDLYIWRAEDIGGTGSFATIEDGRFAWHPFDVNTIESARPALRVHSQEHRMLVEAFTNPEAFAELPLAPNAHLKDAIAVRDRLLTLIEAKGIA